MAYIQIFSIVGDTVGFVETVAGIDGGSVKTALLGGTLEEGIREEYFEESGNAESPAVGVKLGNVYGVAVGDAVFKAVVCTDGE